ncbi:hypothetical protein [Niallia sp.]|nr:hypothetical protein [Niallia sp.]
MKVMYTELQMTEEKWEKLKKWEKETGIDAEEKVQELFEEFLKQL